MDSDETRDNRNIDYSIENGNINYTFQITSDTGEILLVKNVDREEISVFTLKVLAMDRGSPARNATADVVIHVDDVNDNPPIFSHKSYEVNISEAQMVGTTILRVAATDRDYGDNAKLIYDITKEFTMTTIINTHDMNSVMEIGENILYLYQGKKEWYGNNKEIIFSKNERLNAFIFASEFLHDAKEMRMLEAEGKIVGNKKAH